MEKEEFRSVKVALNESLSLIFEEYESLIDDDLREKYDGVIEKIQHAIKLMEKYD